MTSFEPLFDHRARLEQMPFEPPRARTALIDQRSPDNSPESRGAHLGAAASGADAQGSRAPDQRALRK